MKHLVYYTLIAAGLLFGLLPWVFAAGTGLFAASVIGLNVRAMVAVDGWDARATQNAVAHGLMLFVMALMVGAHNTFVMKAVVAMTAVPPIWYDGKMLIDAIRGKL